MTDILDYPDGRRSSVRSHDEGDGTFSKAEASHLRAWDATAGSWVRVTVDHASGGLVVSSSGSGGGAVTVADGADVAQGTTTDLSSASTVIGILKAIKAAITGTLTVAGSLGRSWTLSSGTDSVAASATLSAETTKVIGVTRTADGAGNLLTSTTNALDINIKSGNPTAITANAGSNLNTSALALDATLTGGTQKTKLVDSAGTNAAAVSAAGRVSVDASGVPVPITDNAGSLTVDAPVATPVFVRLSDGAAAITALPVTDNAGSLTVDNAGTFAVQAAATLAAETTKVIGTVNVAAAQTIAATQSGAWTVQPGNTPNTTPWLASVHDGTTKAKVTVANAQPANTDGALLVNAIDTFAGTVLTSASHGVAVVNTDIVNYNGKGIRVWQDLTVLGASSVCQFSIQEKDPVSGKFVTLLASAATGAGINSTGTAKLTIYPGLTAAANVTASDVVPMNIRIVSTVTTAASTFSIGFSLIP